MYVIIEDKLNLLINSITYNTILQLSLFLYYVSPCIFFCIVFYYHVQCFVDFNKSSFQKNLSKYPHNNVANLEAQQTTSAIL